ncbi:FecR domain-containing protein [Porticoccaceae bacterium LTM1]|nr:FecR domain-containing protein [Porticoccaceae bacterium LTM1]
MSIKKFGRARSSDISSQAADDVALLFSSHLNDDDLERMHKHHGDNPELKEEFLDTLHMLDELDELASIEEYRSEYKEVAQTEANKSRSGHWNGWGMSIAAGMVLSATVLFSYVSMNPEIADDGNILRYVTRVGEQKTVELEDGSVIDMNTGSEILVDIGSEERVVTLVRGEAFFDVAKDPERPFSVKVDGRDVTVLGTSFDILKTPDEFTLCVLEGVVSVHKAESEVVPESPEFAVTSTEEVVLEDVGQRLVKKGIVVSYSSWDDEVTAKCVNSPERLVSWRKKLLSYNGETLSDVIQEFNRYSAKKILIKDSSVMDLNIYATFRLDRIDIALSDLEKILPIKVTRHHDRIVISSK